MCSGNTTKAQGINDYLSNPANNQFSGGENDMSKTLTNMAGGRAALTAENQARYDKMPWAPKQPAASLGSGPSGAASARGQPAAKTVSSTILGGTA